MSDVTKHNKLCVCYDITYYIVEVATPTLYISIVTIVYKLNKLVARSYNLSILA